MTAPIDAGDGTQHNVAGLKFRPRSVSCTDRGLNFNPATLCCVPSPASMGAVMTDQTNPVPPSPGGLKIAPGSSELAPFIYFDGVPTYGVNAGAIQLELAANVLLPDGKGVKIDVVITAHLRCSPVAAVALREAINQALAIQQGQQQIAAPTPGAKPN